MLFKYLIIFLCTDREFQNYFYSCLCFPLTMSRMKRSKKTTLYQYEIMLDFFENHPEMISGKHSDSFTNLRREELWAELSTLLNSVNYGPQKTPAKWRKTWVDIKSETKQKAKEEIEQGHFNGSLRPLPVHLARIRSILGLSNVTYYKIIKGNNCADQSPIKIKECFTEEMTSNADVLNNGEFELDDKTNPVIKIENISDILSSSENTCFENGPDIPSTSAESFGEKVTDILTTSAETPCEDAPNISTSAESTFELMSGTPTTSAETSCEDAPNISTSAESTCEQMSDITITSAETPCEDVPNISTSAESTCEQMSDNLSTVTIIPCEKVSYIPSVNEKSSFQNTLDNFSTSSDTSSRKCSVNLSNPKKSSSYSRPKKTTCEKICDILTTSVNKLNDVVKNSENRTITALNALTEATVRSNELHEKQLQIEKERNRLYQERTQILSTLVNAFVEKKVNHQY